MNPNMLLVIAGYILFICGLIAIPVKQKKVMAIAGNCLYSFPKKRTGFIVGVEITAFVLITLSVLMNYTFFITMILCACGVLGAWIVVGEAALGSKYGLYDNGIVAVGKYIPYDDIVTFPILNLPKEEQKHYPQNVLVIASRKYGNIEVPFDSDEICGEVIRILRKLCYAK